MRLHANGAVDSSFGGDGVVTTAIDAGNEVANAVAIQSDGRIVVAGSSQVTGNAYLDFMLLRHNPNGSPDATFSDDGEVVTPMGVGDDAAHDLAIQPDGSIVVAGGVADGSGPTDFVLARFQANGALDPAYGSGGIARIDFDGGYDGSRALALDTDGHAVAVGFAFGQFAAARVLGDDPSTSAGVTLAGSAQFYVGAPHPNPTRDGVALSIELPSADRVTARVVDVAGRTLRTVSRAQTLGPGHHTLAWDGRDDGGAAVASGVYFLQVQAKGGTQARRITILRPGN